MQFDMSLCARVNADALSCRATIRQEPSHFKVEEVLPFTPEGVGGHVFLLIEKTQTNTEWLSKQLAQFANVPLVDIGYAGLKDRHAITTQWFSVKVEGKTEPDWSSWDVEGSRIIEVHYHTKKLRTGTLLGNRFTLKLTQIQGENDIWEKALEQIKQNGAPNYFAEQRFGRDYNNLNRVVAWFEAGAKPKKRHQKSMLISAARSWLFNQVLSARITTQTWNIPQNGDVLQLSGTHSIFVPDQIDQSLLDRAKQGDIHTTGPLVGQGDLPSSGEVFELEQKVLSNWSDWQQNLVEQGLKQQRRALRVLPESMAWTFNSDDIEVSFFLPAGSYATAVLREIAVIDDAADWN
jgi:tRNA pseudouridine13 synthase